MIDRILQRWTASAWRHAVPNKPSLIAAVRAAVKPPPAPPAALPPKPPNAKARRRALREADERAQAAEQHAGRISACQEGALLVAAQQRRRAGDVAPIGAITNSSPYAAESAIDECWRNDR